MGGMSLSKSGWKRVSLHPGYSVDVKEDNVQTVFQTAAKTEAGRTIKKGRFAVAGNLPFESHI